MIVELPFGHNPILRYNSITIDGSSESDGENVLNHPLKLLKIIWEDSSIADNVEDVHFYETDQDELEADQADQAEDELKGLIRDFETTDGQSFLAACLDHTPLLHHPDLRQRCLFHILEGRQCYAMILLILTLPNLTSFKFCLRNEWDAELLTAVFTSPTLSSKLSTVSCYHWDTEFFTPIENLLIFALCPTVRTLEGEMTGCEGFDPANIPCWENAISNVERFHLFNGILDDGDMEAILRPMKNLKAFHYEGNWFPFSDGPPDLQSWIDTLVEVCGQKLEALTITLEQRAKVKTFKGLQKLRELQIDITSLIPRTKDETTSSSDATPGYRVIVIGTEPYKPATAEILALMPKLVDVLPPTIEKVVLFADNERELEIRQLSHDLAAGNERLPMLTEIACVGYRVQVDEGVERELRSVGVEVIWGKC